MLLRRPLSLVRSLPHVRCAAVSAKAVQELRALTGAPMGKCRDALVATGDADAAVRWLKERSMMQVQKLATRTTGEGVVATAIGEGGRAAAAVQILCETDFVGRTDQLRSFAAAVAAASVHSTPDDLQALPLADGETVAEAIARVTAELGERIALGKLAQVALPASAGPLGRCAVYVHNSEGAFGAV